MKPISWLFPWLLLAALSLPGAARGGEALRPRLISLYAAHSDILLRLGARRHLVGVSGQEDFARPEWEGEAPPVFSVRDDIEKYLAAEPDLVLARPQHLAGAARWREALERAGIRVLALQVRRPAELYPYWREIAGLVGREAAAAEMIAAFEAALAPYRKTSGRRPGVFLEAIHREVKTFTADSLPAWLVELAGGRNVAAGASPVRPGVVIANFGPEALLGVAGEVEVFVAQSGPMNPVSLEELGRREIYQTLPAFRQGRVYQIEESLLARPTPGLLVGLQQLAAMLAEAKESAAGQGR
ncbi:MAG: ABC transporter substrate-binding protein [Planctomycetota bacterium]|nr:ABC transporter substrate-binding protein [Planctomycetota bacterium]